MSAIVFIPLSQGQTAICDFQDWHEGLRNHNWSAKRDDTAKKPQFYAIAHKPGTRSETIVMHQILAKGKRLDHKNRNGLDNRRCNLRPCTQSQNSANTRREPGVSGYRGVYPTPAGKWIAGIRCNRKLIRLGTFEDKVSAALVRDRAARKHHGEFAILNFGICLLICLTLCGCPMTSTVAPKPVNAAGPSFSGNDLNSGIISLTPRGAKITPDELKYYNQLVTLYGDQLPRATNPGDGVSLDTATGDIYLDKQHTAYLLLMQSWVRKKKEPTGLFKKLLKKL